MGVDPAPRQLHAPIEPDVDSTRVHPIHESLWARVPRRGAIRVTFYALWLIDGEEGKAISDSVL